MTHSVNVEYSKDFCFSINYILDVVAQFRYFYAP